MKTDLRDKKEEFSQCPICDSVNIKIKTKYHPYSSSYGEAVLLKNEVCCCGDCYESVVVWDSGSDERNRSAIKDADTRAALNVLEWLSSIGISKVYVERVFRLEFGSISRWEEDRVFPESGIALLRLIRTFPWVLHVADGGYDKNIVAKINNAVVNGILFKGLAEEEKAGEVLPS